MKGKLALVIMSALAVILSACKREENPDPDQGKVKEIVTSFVFNVSTATATKQTADDTQAAGDHFRGIVDAKLFAYAEGDDKDGKIIAADKAAPKMYDLSSLAAESRISAAQSRRILEMSLPLKTNTMLVYGRAGMPAYPTDDNGITREDKYGKLDAFEVDASAGSANFQLAKRLQDKDRFYTTEKLLAGLLTLIVNTKFVDNNADGFADEAISATEADNTDNPYGFGLAAGTYPALKWRDYCNATGNSPVETTHELYPLEEQLAYLYQQMTTIRSASGELRAASGNAISRTVQDLWSGINAIRCASPISAAEAVAKHMAVQISSRIGEYFHGTLPKDGSAVTEVSFESTNNLITRFTNDTVWPAEDNGATPYKPTSEELSKLLASGDVAQVDMIKFPFCFNMPRGVSYMAFDETAFCFYYPQVFNTSEMTGDPSNPTNPNAGVPYDANSYYFPAEILYFGNSPIRVSDLDHKVADYPLTSADWASEDSWPEKIAKTPGVAVNPSDPSTYKYDWRGQHVVSTTRSVAMKYDINYGVAMLETKVGYSADVLTAGKLYDNNHAVQLASNPSLAASDEPDKEIAITDDSFRLTGVIIGGQPQNVGWDFLPVKARPTDERITTGFIFDKAVSNGTIYRGDGSSFSPNYTVVFDNYNSLADAGQQDKVFVALEFQNCTGEDFFGNCNLIKNEGYFYLIGELDPNKLTGAGAASNNIVWPTDGYVVPPYNADGTSKQVRRVFVQDYMTSATFKFGPNSLHYAYLTVPDLRASSLTFGLSVDIKWSQGLVYPEVIIGGN